MIHHFKVEFLVFACALFVGAPALAQTGAPVKLGQYSDWAAYKSGQETDKICYSYSRSNPENKNPSVNNEEWGFFFVSTFQSGAAVETPNFEPFTFHLQENSNPVITIGSKRWLMRTNGKVATIERPADEVEIVKAMRTGRRMLIDAFTSDGENIQLSFSLVGVSNALDRIAIECGLGPEDKNLEPPLNQADGNYGADLAELNSIADKAYQYRDNRRHDIGRSEEHRLIITSRFGFGKPQGNRIPVAHNYNTRVRYTRNYMDHRDTGWNGYYIGTCALADDFSETKNLNCRLDYEECTGDFPDGCRGAIEEVINIQSAPQRIHQLRGTEWRRFELFEPE